MNRTSVSIGLGALGVSVFLGALWAQRVWHSLADPKLAWAIVTLLLYGLLLWMDRRGWEGRRVALLSMLGFGVMIFSYTFVNLYTSTEHSLPMNAAPEARLVLLGWDFRVVGSSIRDRIAFTAEEVREGLRHLLGRGLFSEGAIVSTCHRSEIYALAGEDEPEGRLARFGLGMAGPRPGGALRGGLPPGRSRRGAAPLPRGRGAGFARAGRERGPRAGPGGFPDRARGRFRPRRCSTGSSRAR